MKAKMTKRNLALAAVVVLAVADVALAAAVVTVDQKNIAFSTGKLVVPKGTVLNFTNSDRTSHNILITGNGVTINSGLQKSGVAFKTPLPKPGEYAVTCGIHPKMKLALTVQ